jgi:hypothetical protein
LSTPYIEVYNPSNLDNWAALGKAPYYQLPPDDIKLLTANQGR